METFNQEKIYFIAGDVVTIKHNLPNKPIMLVKSKEKVIIAGENKSQFHGMRCIWFSTDNVLQEAVFSTKDLKHVE